MDSVCPQGRNRAAEAGVCAVPTVLPATLPLDSSEQLDLNVYPVFKTPASELEELRPRGITYSRTAG